MFRNSVTSVDILLVSCSLLLLPPDCSGCDSWCPSLVEPQVLQGQAASEDISGCCQLHGFPGGDGGPSLPQVAPWEEAQTCSLRNGLSSTLILGSVLRPQALPAWSKLYFLVIFHTVKCHLGILWPKACWATKEERRFLPPEFMPLVCPETLNILLALMRAKFYAKHATYILLLIPLHAMCYMCPQMRKIMLNEVTELTQII